MCEVVIFFAGLKLIAKGGVAHGRGGRCASSTSGLVDLSTWCGQVVVDISDLEARSADL